MIKAFIASLVLYTHVVSADEQISRGYVTLQMTPTKMSAFFQGLSDENTMLGIQLDEHLKSYKTLSQAQYQTMLKCSDKGDTVVLTMDMEVLSSSMPVKKIREVKNVKCLPEDVAFKQRWADSWEF